MSSFTGHSSSVLMRAMLAGAALSFHVVPGAAAQSVSSVPQASVFYADGLRRWTPQISAIMRYYPSREMLSAGQYFDANKFDSDVTVPSPDGHEFFFLSNRGGIECNCHITNLEIYSSNAVVSAIRSGGTAQPLRSIEMRSPAMTASAIIAPRWTNDGKEIEFTGYLTRDSIAQLYSFHVSTGIVEPLTEIPKSEQIQSSWSRGDAIIYKTSCVIANSPLTRSLIVLPQPLGDSPHSRIVVRFYAKYRRGPSWLIDGNLAGNSEQSISPDGRYAVLIQKSGRFVLADLRERRIIPIVDRATGTSAFSGGASYTGAFWGNRRHLLLLDVVTSAPRAIDAKLGSAISFDLETSSWTILGPMEHSSGAAPSGMLRLVSVSQILVPYRETDYSASKGVIYSFANGRWSIRDVPRDFSRRRFVKRISLDHGLQVRLQQSPNEPPFILASIGKIRLPLTKPDPALEGVWIAPTTDFSWKDRQGDVLIGGLVLPREIPRIGRIPLVIQIDEFCGACDSLFLPDGDTTTALASQAIAAQGMAVLNIGLPELRSSGGSKEIGLMPDRFVDQLRTAIDALSRQYPIDREHTGLVGFSAGGFFARYAAVHSGSLHLAAVIIADSATQTFGGYIDGVAKGWGQNLGIEAMNGGPFYQAKSQWFSRNIGFHTDSIQSPILFVYNGPHDDALETSGLFVAARRPFDMIQLDDSHHLLISARARKISMEATVDWMNFWLRGKENERAEDPDRYLRWRKIQAAWQAQKLWESDGHPAGSMPSDR